MKPKIFYKNGEPWIKFKFQGKTVETCCKETFPQQCARLGVSENDTYQNGVFNAVIELMDVEILGDDIKAFY